MVKYYSKTFFSILLIFSTSGLSFITTEHVTFQQFFFKGNTRCLTKALFSNENCYYSQLSPEETHKPSMFQSYIKVIFSYLKLPYFILNLCIAEQLFTPHISVVYFISSWIRHLPIRHGWAISEKFQIGGLKTWNFLGS